MTTSVAAFERAEQRALDSYGVAFRSRYLELREPRLRARVVEVGEGDPLVMVHGGGSFATDFAPLMAQLRGLRLISVDRPGCGLTDAFNYRGVDLRAHGVCFLESLLDALELERAPILGNSMGGLWAFWLALDRPSRVSRLIQVGYPALILGTGAPIALRLLSVRGLNRLLWRLMRPDTEAGFERGMAVLGEQQALAGLTEEFKQLMIASKRLPGSTEGWLTLVEDACQLLGKGDHWKWSLGEAEMRRIQQPTLLVWGDGDTHGSLEVARRARAVLPNAGLVEVRHAGHLPWLDNPRACADAVVAFLHEDAAPIPASMAGVNRTTALSA